MSHDELVGLYDAVVYSFGAQTDRRMGIPGEDLPGSWPATAFVAWYNGQHLHSAIGFVTPDQRHHDEDLRVLARRRAVYAAACSHRPERWTGRMRAWDAPGLVPLNPREASTRAR